MAQLSDVSELGRAASFGHGNPGRCHPQFAGVCVDAHGGRGGSGRQGAAAAAEETLSPIAMLAVSRGAKFMADVLGIELPEEVLPLSNIPAIVPPLFPGA